MKVKEIIKLIENDGWRFNRQKGSHMVYTHPIKKGIVVVPNHGMNDDIKKGTEISILKQAGLR
jgi:predicted RNA binding protein YcfA (HicA-like mRNA interferase family)